MWERTCCMGRKTRYLMPILGDIRRCYLKLNCILDNTSRNISQAIGKKDPRMFKTSLFKKDMTRVSVLHGSFLTAQSWGLCREGFLGKGNKGAWTVMAHQDLPRLRVIELPSQTTAKQTHHTAIWVFLCAAGCYHIDNNSTSVTLLPNPRLLSHSLSFHPQTFHHSALV